MELRTDGRARNRSQGLDSIYGTGSGTYAADFRHCVKFN